MYLTIYMPKFQINQHFKSLISHKNTQKQQKFSKNFSPKSQEMILISQIIITLQIIDKIKQKINKNIFFFHVIQYYCDIIMVFKKYFNCNTCFSFTK